MMAFVMRFLAENPEHRRSIRDNPSRIAFAIEEIMRRYGAANNIRAAIDDVDLDQIVIKRSGGMNGIMHLPLRWPAP